MSEHHWAQLEARAAQVMAQPQPLSTPLPSPCVSLCLMHPSAGWCEGCLRTLPEIGGWSQASPDDKRRVWLQLPARVQARRALEGGVFSDQSPDADAFGPSP